MNQGTLQSLLVEDADKKRLEELRAFVIYHNHRYHTLDAPEITDDEYNAAFQELLRLEERHPEWRSPDSPTNRIGGPGVVVAGNQGPYAADVQPGQRVRCGGVAGLSQAPGQRPGRA